MQKNEVKKLTKEEIKKIIFVSIRYDSFATKCFVDLVLEIRENSREEIEMLQNAKKLLNELKIKEALQCISKL